MCIGLSEIMKSTSRDAVSVFRGRCRPRTCRGPDSGLLGGSRGSCITRDTSHQPSEDMQTSFQRALLASCRAPCGLEFPAP